MSVVRAAMIDLIQTESAKTYGDKITGTSLNSPLAPLRKWTTQDAAP